MVPPDRQNLRRRARAVASVLAGRLGYELVRKHFYSPIPDLDALPPDVWSRRHPMPGLRLDHTAGLRFLRDELATFAAEYRPPAGPGADGGFYLDNGLYGSVDAETLYAMIRRFQPARVVELGSGMSTLVIGEARRRNAQPARAGHAVYDPYPRNDLREALEAVASVRSVSATDVPQEVFDELEAGDILFVDTTHTVKTGGDVNRVVLDIMPRLAAGVIVHVHDVYLPFEYPREFLAERRFFWAEQYLLQAFLAFNEEFEVLFAAHALARLHADELRGLVPSHGFGVPSAFWMRRLSPSR